MVKDKKEARTQILGIYVNARKNVMILVLPNVQSSLLNVQLKNE